MRETASKSALLLSGCVRWAHPAAKWYQDRNEDSSAREDGKIVHEDIHLYAQGLPYNAPAPLQAKIDSAIRFYDKLKERCVWVRTEIAMGVNVNTGKAVLIEVQDREYPQDDDVFYGTADVVAMLSSGKLLIGDWKTGGGDGAEEQLKSLAWMATTLFPNDGLRIATLYINNDEVIPVERELADAELQEHVANIRIAVSKARGTAKPSLPIVGAYCSALYCPHLAKCPSTQIDTDALLSHSEESQCSRAEAYEWEEEPSSTEHAGWMASRLKAIKRQQEYYQGHLKDWVRKGNRAILGEYEYKETGRGFMLVKR